MTTLEKILEHNKKFIEEKEYEKYRTTKYPNKKIVILSCMDTRLTDLLPKAMNVNHGDAKIIKNAGAIVSHPFGSIMRSILVALYSLQGKEVYIVGHRDCGMTGLQAGPIIEKALENGVEKEKIEMLKHAGIDIEDWLHGFTSVEDSVKQSVEMVKYHPLFPKAIPVHGLIIDPETGKLDLVVNGHQD